MLVFKCEQPTFFDIDGTLVRWRLTQDDWNYNRVIKVPFIGDDGQEYCDYIAPHERHIQQLKQHKARGHTIIAWSAGGEQWAAKAVRLLGLEPFIDLVISKPLWAYDDLKANEFIQTQYIEDKPEVIE